MTIPLISIGNSKGIRLSKTIIEKYGLKESLEVILEKDCIILKPVSPARKDWPSAFRQMHERGEDKLIMDDVLEDDSFGEWK